MPSGPLSGGLGGCFPRRGKRRFRLAGCHRGLTGRFWHGRGKDAKLDRLFVPRAVGIAYSIAFAVLEELLWIVVEARADFCGHAVECFLCLANSVHRALEVEDSCEVSVLWQLQYLWHFTRYAEAVYDDVDIAFVFEALLRFAYCVGVVLWKVQAGSDCGLIAGVEHIVVMFGSEKDGFYLFVHGVHFEK